MKLLFKVALSISLLAVVASSSLAVPAAKAAGAKTIATTVNDRLADLEVVLSKSLSCGQIDAHECDNFRSILARIAEEKVKYDVVAAQCSPGQTLGLWEENRLQRALDRIEKSILLSLGDRRSLAADFINDEASLASSINEAADAHRLSESDAKLLRQKLSKVQALRASLERNSKLSFGDSLLVAFQCDSVRHELAAALTDRPALTPNISMLQADSAKSVGELTGESFPQLQKEHDALVMAVSKLAAIRDAWQHSEDQLRIAAQFELIRAEGERAKSGKLNSLSPDDFALNVDRKIAGGLMDGRIEPEKAQEFLAELSGIGAEKGQNNDGTAGDISRRWLELTRLSERVERAIHVGNDGWSGARVLARTLGERIALAQSSNRLNEETAASIETSRMKLCSDLDQAQPNKLDAAQSLDLCMRLQRLSIDLSQALADRESSAPDVSSSKKQLECAIADGIETGRLQPDSAFTEMLAGVQTLENSYSQAPGGVDLRAKLAIAEQSQRGLQQIAAREHHDWPQAQPLDDSLNVLRERIAAAVATGMMPTERAKQYTDGVDVIFSQLGKERNGADQPSATAMVAIWQDVNALRTQLENELMERSVSADQLAEQYASVRTLIGVGLSKGKLTLGEAESFNVELGRQLDYYFDQSGTKGGISHGEALAALFQAEKLQTAIENRLRDQPLPPVDVVEQIIKLQGLAANAVAGGRLPVAQATKLQQDLDELTMESARSGNNNELNYCKAIALFLDVAHLSTKVANAVSVVPVTSNDVDARQAQLAARIKAAQAQHVISIKQADNLSEQLDRIALSEAAFRTSDETLSLGEAISLVQDEDRLNAQIQAVSKPQLTLKSKH